MEVCDERTMQAAVAAEKHRAETGSGSDFEEDIAIATGKPSTVYQTSKPKKGKTDSDVESSDDQFDDYGPSDDEDFDSEGDNLDSEEKHSFDEEVVKKNEAKKTKSKKNGSPKAKNKVNDKKPFTKSKDYASDSKGENFNNKEELIFDKEVLKKEKSKKNVSKKVESPKSNIKNKVNGKNVLADIKNFASDSEDESSFDEEKEMRMVNILKKAPTKKLIDSPFPKCKNKGKKATVNHDFGDDSEELSEVESSFDEEIEIDMNNVGKWKKTLTKKQADSPFPKFKVSMNGKRGLAKSEKLKDIKKKGTAKQLMISDDSEESEQDMDEGKTDFIICIVKRRKVGKDIESVIKESESSITMSSDTGLWIDQDEKIVI